MAKLTFEDLDNGVRRSPIGRRYKKGSPEYSAPTERQAQAVQNLLSGQFNSPTKAIMAAGYKRRYSIKQFTQQKGVQRFLKLLDHTSLTKYNMTVADKVVNVITEALDAKKPYGRNAELHDDWAIRMTAASRVTEIMGLKPVEAPVAAPVIATQNIQYNYFSTPKQEQKDFNQQFIDFVSDFKPAPLPIPRASDSTKEPPNIPEKP